MEVLKANRKLLYLIGCIGTRTLLTYLSTNPKLLPYIGKLSFLIALGFFYIYIFGSERANKQLEWLGDKKTWHDQLRGVHGALYLTFAISAMNNKSSSWVFLALDTLIGLIVWYLHTYHKLDFS